MNHHDLNSSLSSIWSHHPIPSYEIISCETGDGLNVFERNLQSQVSNIIYGEDGSQSTEDILITRQRHRQHLLSCVEHLDLFLNCNLTMDLAAEELR
jgi:tRNA U34 5-carboxymethylaminomethyl modifying GTPase MnmE/TrmE